MSNFRNDISAAAGDEAILAIVVGDMGWRDYNTDCVPRWEELKALRGQVLSWDVAAPLLDFDYDTGYGAPSCPCITAWTENYVLFVSQYDGATCLECVPRNPVAHEPSMPVG